MFQKFSKSFDFKKIFEIFSNNNKWLLNCEGKKSSVSYFVEFRCFPKTVEKAIEFSTTQHTLKKMKIELVSQTWKKWWKIRIAKDEKVSNYVMNFNAFWYFFTNQFFLLFMSHKSF